MIDIQILVSQAPDDTELIIVNSTCVNLKLSSWNNGGCPIHHFSIEHRPLGKQNSLQKKK